MEKENININLSAEEHPTAKRLKEMVKSETGSLERTEALLWWNKELTPYKRWWYMRFKHTDIRGVGVEDIVEIHKREKMVKSEIKK